MAKLTCPGCQIGDITEQIVRDSVEHKGILNARHQVADKHPLHCIFFKKHAGHVVTLRDIFSVYVFGILHWPPSYHVSFDSTLWSWPFQSHVRRIDDWSDIKYWIGSWNVTWIFWIGNSYVQNVAYESKNYLKISSWKLLYDF